MEQAWVNAIKKLADEFPEMRQVLDESERLSQSVSELVRRASLARAIDRGLYDSVLSQGLSPPPPAFDRLGELPEIEAVPYQADTYWVKESARSQAQVEWRAREDESYDWSRRIAEYYGSDATPRPLAHLEALIRSKDATSAVVFEQLFRAADRRFDLATMKSLLDVVEANLGFAASDLYEAWLGSSRLYGARALFRQEFHQAVSYFQRPGLQRQFRRFLRSKTRWIFHVHGPGGLGKTMMVRWLISHRLILRRMCTCCVKLDFDDYSLAAIAQDPWLLALPIAEQLDPQVGFTEFRSLAGSLSTYSALLRGTLGEEAYAPNEQAEFSTSLAGSAAAGPDYWPQLERAFSSIPGNTRIILFLDTLEQASQFYPSVLLDILSRLQRLRDLAPGLRVVLTGRYALGLEQVPDFRKLYGKVTLYSRLRRFTIADSLRFIAFQAPQLDAARSSAIADRSEGNPFKLRMMTDLVAGDDDITEAEIRGPKFDQIDLVYLIDRVVKRIPEKQQLPVRWVVRYGAIPRRLTREFMEKVLLQPLERALAGEVVEVGDDLVDEAITQGLWKANPLLNLDAGEVWRQLSQYSGKNNWIFVDARDAGRASLHPDVVRPARKLLSKQRIFAQLQAAAVKFFEEKQAPIDVLFHKLQAGSTTVLADWESLLLSPDLRRDARKWRRFAEELLDRDFDDAPPAAKVLAHWQAAEAIAAQSNWCYLQAPLEQKLTLSHLAQARSLELAHGLSLIPPSVVFIAEAVDEFQQGGKAAQLAYSRLQSWRPDLNQGLARILQHQAEMQVRLNIEGSEAIFEQALEAATLQTIPDVPPRILHERLGYRYARRGIWTRSLEHYEKAYSLTTTEGVEDRLPPIQRALVELDLSTSRYKAARALLEESKPQLAGERTFDLRARLELAVLRPQKALDVLSRWTAGTGRAAGQRLLLVGEALGQQYQLSEAVSALQLAGQEFDKVGDVSGVDRATVTELMLYLYTARSVDSTSALLEKPLQTSSQNETFAAQWLLARAWVAFRNRRSDDLNRSLADFPKDSPQSRAYRLLIGLSFGAYTASAVDELQSVIEEIEPVTARLTLLEPLVLAQRWPVLSQAQAGKIVQAFECQAEGEEEGALFALRLAELERAIGMSSAAVRRLQEGVPKPAPADSDAALQYLARLDLETRIRHEGHLVAGDVDQQSLFEALASLPAAAAAARLLVADAARAGGNEDAAEALSQEATQLMGQEPLQTLQRIRLTSYEYSATYAGSDQSEPGETSTNAGQELDVSGEDLQAIEAKLTLRSIALSDGALMLFDPKLRFKVRTPSTPFLSLVARSHEKESMGEDLAKYIAEDWRRVAAEMEMALELKPSHSDEPKRLLLDTSPNLARLPWEFINALRSERPAPVRYAALGGQRSDGPLQSIRRLGQVLTYFAQESKAEKMRPETNAPRASLGDNSLQMLVVYPPAELVRGGSGFAYTKLGAIYHRLRVTVVTDPKQFEYTVASTRFDLVLIPSRFTFLGHTTEPALQSLGYRARGLASVLKGNPTIILDTPLPVNPEEAILQLFARNDFAFELLRYGEVRGVIATGLGYAEDIGRIHERLQESVMNSGTLVEIIDHIRQGGPSDETLAKALAYLGTALFTKQPFFAPGVGDRTSA